MHSIIINPSDVEPEPHGPCTPACSRVQDDQSYFKEKKVSFREKSWSKIDLFVLKITFDRLAFGILISFGSPYQDEKYKKELTNFNNYWLRSDNFSSIFVRFRFL